MSDPRVHVTFRLATKGFDWVTMLAASTGRPVSSVIRQALVVAKKYEAEVITRLEEES